MTHEHDIKVGRVSREELLQALDAIDLDDDQDDQDQTPEPSEAERLAALADIPKIRIDGKPRGTERVRPLTAKQMAFAKGLIEGKTQAQAYKDAYPDAQGSHQSMKTSAWKLSRDPRIQAIVTEGWDETVEALSEDQAAVKRYVLKQLLHHSKAAKQEGTKLKALEMMGRSVGMFKAEQRDDTEGVVSAEQLKRELAKHMRLLANVRPLGRADILSEGTVINEPMLIPNAQAQPM